MVDRATLLAAFGGQATLLAETAGVFLADLPAMLERLRLAVQRGNGDESAAAAHAIKGAAGLFSQGEAFESAQRLEQVARAGDRRALEAADGDVVRTMSALTEELKAMVGP